MRLPQKFILLAVVPLCLAVTTIALAVRHQASELATRHHAAIETAYLTSARAELKRQVDLAIRIAAHLYETGRMDTAIRRQARLALASLEAGSGGRFFIYDQAGNNVLHPAYPAGGTEPGGNERRSLAASPVQSLIERADKGGGYVHYSWRKPYEVEAPQVPRLAYVDSLPRWGWVVVSSIDLADLDGALSQVNDELTAHMDQAMLLLAAVAMAAALAAALPGLLAHVGAYRMAHARSRRLARHAVRAQEAQQACLAQHLQDSIGQWLTSIKLQIETALMHINGTPEQALAARCSFASTARQVDDVLAEVRRLTRELRPVTRHKLQLDTALERLCLQWHAHCGDGMRIRFSRDGEVGCMPDMSSALLLQVAREALTNITRQASATEVNVRLHGGTSLVMLQVRDNGSHGSHGRYGFHDGHAMPTSQPSQPSTHSSTSQPSQSSQSAQSAQQPPRQPRAPDDSLRDIRTQLEALGGALALDISSAGTLLSAVVTRDALALPSALAFAPNWQPRRG